MRPSYLPRLVNDPFDDPGLYIPFLYENRAFLFDLGEINALSARDLLKISHVFVTHTHMDHFIGFDRLLRVCLGREKILNMYGPKGFLNNVEGKLAGYAWNLVNHYQNRFVLKLYEVRSKYVITQQYYCNNEFVPTHNHKKAPFDGNLLSEPAVDVSAIILDHRIPCLGLAMTERFHVNIKKDAVISLGLDIGPWLKEFKDALFNGQDPNSYFEIRTGIDAKITHQHRLGDLAEQIAIITPGQKLVYFADVLYNESESEKMIAFAKGADHLYIEAAFLDKDKDIAENKYHLTARQAGVIAGKAEVKKYSLFHYSPRYMYQGHLLEQEAREAYETTVMIEKRRQ